MPDLDLLACLGWDDAWSSALTAHLVASDRRSAARLAPARVSRADRDSCDVLAPGPDGLRTLTAGWGASVQRASRIDPTTAPVTGDWVVLATPHDVAARPAVDAVLPRRSAVLRAQVDGSSHGQLLAANADVAAVVEGMFPDPDPARIERLLALAWSSGARPVLALTKADLVRDPDAQAADLAALAPGVDVLVTSATAGIGLEPLRKWLAEGATVALLGASGVGKSTLLNALIGAPDAVMRTQSLRADGKGRHTTVTRELHLVPGGGALLDTPGMRTVGLAGAEALDEVFPEVEAFAADCRFADCTHRTEPGCAVLAAVESGDLPERRLLSYRKLLREAEHQAARTDVRLRAELTQVWKSRTREYRRRPNRKR